MKALDLFCGAGGASMGLYQAGFEVTGVDWKPQPRYPFTFIQGDALTANLEGYDLIWASPTCQKHTAMRTMHNARPHDDLIPPTRARLMAQGAPWIMENVEGAPLINPIMLCGTAFGLRGGSFELQRHRLFETSFPVVAPPCVHSGDPVIGVYGDHIRDRRRRKGSHARGLPDPPFEHGCDAMGIDWMTLKELSQAIPPAYSRFLAEWWLVAWS